MKRETTHEMIQEQAHGLTHEMTKQSTMLPKFGEKGRFCADEICVAKFVGKAIIKYAQ